MRGPARRRDRDPHDGPVPAAHAVPPAGGPVGEPPRSSRSTPRRARRWGSRTSRPARWCGPPTTPGTQLRRARRSRRHRSADRESEEPACKPDPVRGARAPPATISLGRTSRPAASRFARAVRPTRELGRAALERSLLGLAPDGGCRAATVARRAGGLLPHRCTLTAREREAVSSLLPLREVAPAWLSPASCPAESGLSSTRARRPGPRPPGRLLRGHGTPQRPRRSPARCPRPGSPARPPPRCAPAGRARTSTRSNAGRPAPARAMQRLQVRAS